MLAQYTNIGNAENTIHLKVLLTTLIRREKSDLYVSYCPALDLYSQGTTENKARENIVEAIRLLVESCIEEHTLEQVLEDCGFNPTTRPSSQKRNARKPVLPPEFATARRITIPAEFPVMAYG